MNKRHRNNLAGPSLIRVLLFTLLYLYTQMLWAGSNDLGADGHTPLIKAIKSGNLVEVAQLLSKADIDVNRPNKFEETPLLAAATLGNEEMVKALLAKDDCALNMGAEKGQTALIEAIRNKHTRIVDLLLNDKRMDGAAVNTQNKWGSTALMWAARSGRKDYIDKLMVKGADPLAKNKNGSNALIWAAKDKQSETLNYLLGRPEIGDDDSQINGQNRWKSNALLWSVRNKQREDIFRLLQKGASIDLPLSDGSTIADLVKPATFDEDIVNLFKGVSICKLALKDPDIGGKGIDEFIQHVKGIVGTIPKKPAVKPVAKAKPATPTPDFKSSYLPSLSPAPITLTSADGKGSRLQYFPAFFSPTLGAGTKSTLSETSANDFQFANGPRLTLVSGDIVKQVGVDAVVNTSNKELRGGSNVAGAFWNAGGAEYQAHCQEMITDMANKGMGRADQYGGYDYKAMPGLVAITPATGTLKSANGNKFVFSVVGPDNRNKDGTNPNPSPEKVAFGTDLPKLQLATIHNVLAGIVNQNKASTALGGGKDIKTLAMPTLGTGVYNWDQKVAARNLMVAVESYMVDHPADVAFLPDEIRTVFHGGTISPVYQQEFHAYAIPKKAATPPSPKKPAPAKAAKAFPSTALFATFVDNKSYMADPGSNPALTMDPANPWPDPVALKIPGVTAANKDNFIYYPGYSFATKTFQMFPLRNAGIQFFARQSTPPNEPMLLLGRELHKINPAGNHPWNDCGGGMDLDTGKGKKLASTFQVANGGIKITGMNPGEELTHLDAKREFVLQQALREGIEEMPDFIKDQLLSEYLALGKTVNSTHEREAFLKWGQDQVRSWLRPQRTITSRMGYAMFYAEVPGKYLTSPDAVSAMTGTEVKQKNGTGPFKLGSEQEKETFMFFPVSSLKPGAKGGVPSHPADLFGPRSGMLRTEIGSQVLQKL